MNLSDRFQTRENQIDVIIVERWVQGHSNHHALNWWVSGWSHPYLIFGVYCRCRTWCRVCGTWCVSSMGMGAPTTTWTSTSYCQSSFPLLILWKSRNFDFSCYCNVKCLLSFPGLFSYMFMCSGFSTCFVLIQFDSQKKCLRYVSRRVPSVQYRWFAPSDFFIILVMKDRDAMFLRWKLKISLKYNIWFTLLIILWYC